MNRSQGVYISFEVLYVEPNQLPDSFDFDGYRVFAFRCYGVIQTPRTDVEINCGLVNRK